MLLAQGLRELSVGISEMAVTIRAVAALSLVGLLAVAPAQARDWHGRGGYGGYHRGGGGGAAIAAGIIGLGLGAALASGAYAAPPPAYYGAPPGYYTPPPPAVYYGY